MGIVGFLFDVFGRVRRRDFWLFAAGLAVFYSLLLMPVLPAWNHTEVYGQTFGSWLQMLLNYDLGFIFLIVVQVVTLAVMIKRCHDLDMSGFALFALVVPVLGWLWVGYWLGFREGSDEANRFGPSPKSAYRTL
jgi:uncharacterized membrane protein YhaH (DUF805 family)